MVPNEHQRQHSRRVAVAPGAGIVLRVGNDHGAARVRRDPHGLDHTFVGVECLPGQRRLGVSETPVTS